MKRLGLATLGLLVLVGAGLAAGLAWLRTERGTAWFLDTLTARTAPYLRIGRVEGVVERLTLEDLQIRVAGHEVVIDTLRLAWRPLELLRGEVAIDDLALGTVRYRRVAPEAPDAGGGAGFSMPVRIALGHAALQALTIEVNTASLALGPTELAAVIDGSVVQLERVASITSQGIRLSGAARLELAERMGLEMLASWEGVLGGRAARGRVALEGVWPELGLRHVLEAPFAATIEGSLTFDGPPRADLVASWVDLPLDQAGRMLSPNGELTLTGTLEDYSFRAAAAAVLDSERIDLTAGGRGSRANLSIDSLTLAHEAAALAATGSIALDAREWHLDVRAERLDTAWLASEWPGSLTGTGAFSGRLAPVLEWTLEDVDVQGDLRAQRIGIMGRVDYRDAQWVLGDVRIEGDALEAQLDGRIAAEALALDFTADAYDLAALWPGASGTLIARGQIGGTLQAPSATIDLGGQAVGFGSVTAAALRLDGHAGSTSDSPIELVLAADGVVWGSRRVERARVRVAGTTRAHVAEFSAALMDASRIEMRAQGGLAEAARWQGVLEELTVQQSDLGVWQLGAPAALAVGANAVALGESCLRQRSARVCGQINWAGQPSDRVELMAANLELGLLAPWIPAQLSLAGTYDAELVLTDPSGSPAGTLTVNGDATEIAMNTAGPEPVRVRLARVALSASLEQWGLALSGTVVDGSGAGGTAELTARFDDVRGPDSGLDAALRVRWPDVGFLALLSPDVGEVGGALDVALTATGSVAEPRFGGEVSFQGGHVAVPRWGFAVESIEARGLSSDGRSLEFDATGRIDDAELRVHGSTILDYRSGWPTEMRVSGDTLRVVQLPEAEIDVIPTLSLQASLPDVTVTGTLEVPRARITITDLPAQAVVPSPDAVIHGAETAPPPRPLRVRAELGFSLGDDVRYTGSGLDMKVSGDMALRYMSGQSADATGSLNLDGQYEAYGQSLALEDGELVFAGPLNDPVLDVRALRRIEAQTVGLHLTGRLTAPETRIFSEPALGEAEALSYLLFGTPLVGSGAQDAAALQSAALSLGLQQALPVVRRIGQSIGLDEITVQATSTEAGEIMAGKYLSPRVYIRYSYGLFNRMGGVLLRFRVNDRFSVETRSGDQSSMDLLYTVERD